MTTPKSDQTRQAEVDSVRIAPIQPDRDKRTESGRKRYVRTTGNFNLMLAACRCSYAVRLGKPGGICMVCEGAILTGDEQAR